MVHVLRRRQSRIITGSKNTRPVNQLVSLMKSPKGRDLWRSESSICEVINQSGRTYRHITLLIRYMIDMACGLVNLNTDIYHWNSVNRRSEYVSTDRIMAGGLRTIVIVAAPETIATNIQNHRRERHDISGHPSNSLKTCQSDGPQLK